MPADISLPFDLFYKSDSNSQPTNAKRPRRKRLRSDGVEILGDFFEHVSHYPTEHEKSALLARIREIEGCEKHTYTKISIWFNAQRAKLNRKEKQQQPDQILFPSLTKGVTNRLEALLRDCPDPGDAILAIWATKLGSLPRSVSVEDIKTWIQLQRAMRQRRERTDGTEIVFCPHYHTTPDATSSDPPPSASATVDSSASPVTDHAGLLGRSQESTDTDETKLDELDKSPSPSMHLPSSTVVHYLRHAARSTTKRATILTRNSTEPPV